jgi:hypothetical protein
MGGMVMTSSTPPGRQHTLSNKYLDLLKEANRHEQRVYAAQDYWKAHYRRKHPKADETSIDVMVAERAEVKNAIANQQFAVRQAMLFAAGAQLEQGEVIIDLLAQILVRTTSPEVLRDVLGK